jgi:glycosyltransferase involved in cell wall biosynthesis
MPSHEIHTNRSAVKRPLALLFVKLDLGGIETYFAKLSHTLVQERKVLVCSLKQKRHQSLMAMFHPSVQVVSPIALAWLVVRRGKRGIDLLATGRNTALWAGLLEFLSSHVRVRLGVYSQYELSERSEGALRRAYAWVYRRLGPGRIFFCTQGLKDKQAGLDGQYAVSPVVPLTVSVPAFCKHHAACAARVKLVTVGRFVDFKRYLWVLPGVVAELEAVGIQAELDIYGYGPLEESLRACIQQSPAAVRISIKGKINPQDIDRALLDADLFIGSGSMLLEAASRGVPSIVCIDSNREPTSPGYLHESPLNFTSEERSGVPMMMMSGLVQRYLNMDARGRNSFFRDSFEYCKHYDAERVGASLLNIFHGNVSV